MRAAGRRHVVRPAVLALLVAALAAAPAGAAGPRALWHLPLPARGTPAHDGVSAYFLTHDHELVAASLASGRVRWRLVLDRTAPTFGSRVIVHRDTVVAGDYDLVGVDRRTGQRRWLFVAPDGGGSAMHLGDRWGDLVLSGSLAGVVRAIATSDGVPRWTVPVGPAATTTVYRPVVDGSMIGATFTTFGATPSGGLVVVEARTGRKRWQRSVPGSSGASGDPAFAAGMVFAAARDGLVHGFDAASGQLRRTLPAVQREDQDYRPLAASGSTLVAGSLSGDVVAWDVRSQRVLWRAQPSMASVAFAVAIHQGAVLVPYLSNQLIALDLRNGRELWRLGTPTAEYRWVPDADRNLLVASGSRVISLFRHELMERRWR